MDQPPTPVPNLLQRLWRHPRRLGFMIFNAFVLVVIIAWGLITLNRPEGQPETIPAMLAGIAGMVVLIFVWIGLWVAWGLLLLWRRRPR